MRGRSSGTSNLIQFPSDPSEAFQLVFVWPCFNCHSPMEVDQETFRQLETKQLLGLKCPGCLKPPPESGLVRAA